MLKTIRDQMLSKDIPGRGGLPNFFCHCFPPCGPYPPVIPTWSHATSENLVPQEWKYPILNFSDFSIFTGGVSQVGSVKKKLQCPPPSFDIDIPQSEISMCPPLSLKNQPLQSYDFGNLRFYDPHYQFYLQSGKVYLKKIRGPPFGSIDAYCSATVLCLFFHCQKTNHYKIIISKIIILQWLDI